MSTFEWRPARLLLESDEPEDLALMVLNTPLQNSQYLRRLWRKSSLRVAADGGANRLHKLSTFHAKFSNLQAIVGDLDSLLPIVRDFYTSQPVPAQVIHDPDQYSTDFGKSVAWIRNSRPSGIDIVALGGIGGRVDQGISQLHQLYTFQEDAQYSIGRLYLLSGSSLTFLLKAGSHRIVVKEDDEELVFGKHCGIIPLREPSVISTKGLEWDVTDWKTQIGGNLSTSNHVLPETKEVEIETSTDVLFTIALSQVDSDDA